MKKNHHPNKLQIKNMKKMKSIQAMIGGIGGAVMGATLALALTAAGFQAPVLADRIMVDNSPPDRKQGGALAGYADVVERVSPSIVSIYASRKATPVKWEGFGFEGDSPLRRFFEDRDLERFFGDRFGNGENGRGQPAPRRGPMPKQHGLGSGVLLTSDGYVLTNNHVIEGAEEIRVALNEGGTEHDAKVVGRDPQTDLAVLKIDARKLPAATVGDSSQLRPGDAVLAIGNPFGLNKTVTSGIVSATGRNNLNITGYEDFIQTDASINPGNSGGALVDNRGRVVGINTAIFSRTGGNVGIGFAIPINMALEIADHLMTDGQVERGYLGVMLAPLTPDLAKAMDVEGQGVLVNEVMADTPAQEAGFKGGDVIIGLDGESVRDLTSLRFKVGGIEPGEKAIFTVLRDGVEVELTAKIGKLDPDKFAGATGSLQDVPDAGKAEFIDGVRVLELTENLRNRYAVSEDIGQGLLVVELDPESAAADAGLREGDVITEVSQEPVESVKQAIAAKKQSKNGMLLLRVASADASRFLAIDMS